MPDSLRDRPAPSEQLPRPGLVVVTGASHTGKSSVVAAIREREPSPVALLGVDEIVTGLLSPRSENPWRHIPLAYDLIEAQLPVLLDDGWAVMVESTFTFVERPGVAEFHAERLDALLAIAERRGVPWLVCQLRADEAALIARLRATERLDETIVLETARLHSEADLPGPLLRLPSDGETPAELGARIVARISSSA